MIPSGCYVMKTRLAGSKVVRRHIVGGAKRTLISAETPLRLCHIGTCHRLLEMDFETIPLQTMLAHYDLGHEIEAMPVLICRI